MKEKEKEVKVVNHLTIKSKGYQVFELQLNGEYYLISEDQIRAIDGVRYLPEGTGVSVG